MSHRHGIGGGEAVDSLPTPDRLPSAEPLPDGMRLAEAERLDPPPSPGRPGPACHGIQGQTVNQAIERTYRLPEPEAGRSRADGDSGRRGSILAGIRARLPWLLALLAALLASVLLFFLIAGDEEEEPAPATPAPDRSIGAPKAVEGTSVRPTNPDGPKPESKLPGLGGVTMPLLGPGDRPARPVALLLVTDSNGRIFKREAGRLAAWMASTQRPSSRIRVLRRVAGGWTISPAVSAAAFDPSASGRPASVSGGRRWLDVDRHRRFERVAITVGDGPLVAGSGKADALRVGLSKGAPVPSASSADPRRKGGLAAVMAVKVARAANQVLSRQPELRK